MSVNNTLNNTGPNLKPLGSVSSFDIVPFFAHKSGNKNKGTVVKIDATTAEGNTNVRQNTAGAQAYLTPSFNDLGDKRPSYVYQANYEVAWKIDDATSGDLPFGILLHDIRTKAAFGEDIHFHDRERREGTIVESGNGAPVLTRGLVKTNAYASGQTPSGNLGAYVSFTEAGMLDAAAYDSAREDLVGKWLTTADADGYAVLKVEL